MEAAAPIGGEGTRHHLHGERKETQHHPQERGEGSTSTTKGGRKATSPPAPSSCPPPRRRERSSATQVGGKHHHPNGGRRKAPSLPTRPPHPKRQQLGDIGWASSCQARSLCGACVLSKLACGVLGLCPTRMSKAVVAPVALGGHSGDGWVLQGRSLEICVSVCVCVFPR